MVTGTDAEVDHGFRVVQASVDFRVLPTLRVGAPLRRIANTSGTGHDASGPACPRTCVSSGPMSADTPDPQAQAAALRAAIDAVEGQRALLGDAAVELALAPLRQRLAALAEPPRLQRRQVTVMFADIVASTSMIQRLDPEDVIVVLGDMLARAEACVQAHGGRRLRFTGDGLKAAFGVDAPREDDPERAVRAALAILAAGREHAAQVRERHGVSDFALRVGLHTGEVVFGAGVEQADTLVGDAVHLAARMEQSAPPNTVHLSRETWNHVRGQFDAEEMPPLQVKGVERPLRTYLVRGPRAGAAAERGVDGVAVPLVGRDADLARLQAAPRCTLIGDAGVGKTRLLREALAGRRAAAVPGRVLEARAQPDAGLRPWGIVWQLLAAQCGVSDGDAAAVVRERVVAGLAPWLGADGATQARFVGQIVGLDFGDDPAWRGADARAVRDRALQALRGWLEALAAHDGGPPLLVLQDLHWADDASLDWVAGLLADEGVAVHLWCNARPALLERRPAWPEAGRLQLQPLAPEAGRLLAQRLLPGGGAIPASLVDDLVARAEGNPYYLEELVRRLHDEGVLRMADDGGWSVDVARLASLRLPTTLVGLLQARLHALPDDERRGAQAASIVGHVFWDEAVGEVDARALQAIPALEQRAWVRSQPTSAFVDSREHRFDHHLLHQVTYETVLKGERRQGHEAVARWMAARTADRAPEFLAITGDHAERAGDVALAIDCFSRASVEAQRRFANALAIECAQRALRLLPADDLKARHRQWRQLVVLSSLVGDPVLYQQSIDELAAIVAQWDDPAAEADLRVRQALHADRRGRLQEAQRFAEQAVAAGERAGAAADADVALAWAERAWLHNLRHETEAARECLRRGLVHAHAARDTQPAYEIQLRLMEGIVAHQAGDPALARQAMEEVLVLSEARSEPRAALGAYDHLCSVAVAVGDGARALALAERMLELAQSLGATPRVGQALHRVAHARLMLGDRVRARAAGEEALAAACRVGDHVLHARMQRWLADVHREAGDLAAARAGHERAHAMYAALDADSADLWLVAARLALDDVLLGALDAARERVDRVLDAVDRGVDLQLGEEPFEGWWALHQALVRLGHPRAGPLLQQLKQLAQAEAVRLSGSDAAMAGRVLHQSPLLAAIMAA